MQLTVKFLYKTSPSTWFYRIAWKILHINENKMVITCKILATVSGKVTKTRKIIGKQLEVSCNKAEPTPHKITWQKQVMFGYLPYN